MPPASLKQTVLQIPLTNHCGEIRSGDKRTIVPRASPPFPSTLPAHSPLSPRIPNCSTFNGTNFLHKAWTHTSATTAAQNRTAALFAASRAVEGGKNNHVQSVASRFMSSTSKTPPGTRPSAPAAATRLTFSTATGGVSIASRGLELRTAAKGARLNSFSRKKPTDEGRQRARAKGVRYPLSSCFRINRRSPVRCVTNTAVLPCA